MDFKSGQLQGMSVLARVTSFAKTCHFTASDWPCLRFLIGSITSFSDSFFCPRPCTQATQATDSDLLLCCFAAL
jgi:hypothetical protein